MFLCYVMNDKNSRVFIFPWINILERGVGEMFFLDNIATDYSTIILYLFNSPATL